MAFERPLPNVTNSSVVRDVGHRYRDKVVYYFGRVRSVRGLRPHAEGPFVADAMIDALPPYSGISVSSSGYVVSCHIAYVT